MAYKVLKNEEEEQTEVAPEVAPEDPVQAAIRKEHENHVSTMSHVTGIHATPAEIQAREEAPPVVVLPKGEYTPAKKGNGPVQ